MRPLDTHNTEAEMRGGHKAVSHRVLPRFLRKPVRSFARLASAGYQSSRNVWVGLCLGVFLVSGVAGWVTSTPIPAKFSKMTADAGFAVRAIEISGNERVSTQAVQEILADLIKQPLIELDVRKVQERLQANPWIGQVNVAKKYPDTLQLEMFERRPFGVWQTRGRFKLIDRAGIVLTDFGSAAFDAEFAHLPQFVGDGANIAADSFVQEIREFPMLSARARAYVRVADRRWDLAMENDITVKLPEKNVGSALAEFQRLEGSYDLLSRELNVVDMRLADRVILRLDEQVVQSRSKAFEKRVKDARKKETQT